MFRNIHDLQAVAGDFRFLSDVLVPLSSHLPRIPIVVTDKLETLVRDVLVDRGNKIAGIKDLEVAPDLRVHPGQAPHFMDRCHKTAGMQLRCTGGPFEVYGDDRYLEEILSTVLEKNMRPLVVCKPGCEFQFANPILGISVLLTVSPTGNTHINQASPRRDVVNTHQKALSINLDPGKYGTLAEIGGGQEVARWFFRVGGASGTVAKTISAYDMTFSDSIYGVCGKYVSRRRVETMLDHEYELLQERLLTSRGSESRFFAFADTVTTRSFSGERNGHGWLGIRFQTHPGACPSQIIIHLQLWGEESIQDQETLGIFGINLIYGAYHYHQDASLLIESLADAIPIGRMEVDVVEFSGPSFDKIDNRLMCLKLVETGLAKAAIFNSEGAIMEPSELFYKKSVLIQRGTFRPVTRLTMDMLRCAMEQFIQDTGIDSQKVVVLQEMSLQNLTTHEACSGIDSADFLERVDCLSALGYPVAISNHGTFHRLATYLFRYTQEPSGLVMGIPTLLELFKERYYADLSGGILESFGRLFKHELKLYIHPWRDPEHGQLVTAENVLVQAHLRHLYQYLHDNQYIHSIQGHDPGCLDIHSHRVLEMIQCQMRGWEADVPEKVAMLIRKKGFFGSPKKRPVSDEPSQVP